MHGMRPRWGSIWTIQARSLSLLTGDSTYSCTTWYSCTSSTICLWVFTTCTMKLHVRTSGRTPYAWTGMGWTGMGWTVTRTHDGLPGPAGWARVRSPAGWARVRSLGLGARRRGPYSLAAAGCNSNTTANNTVDPDTTTSTRNACTRGGGPDDGDESSRRRL
jgi:hypothetical protein